MEVASNGSLPPVPSGGENITRHRLDEITWQELSLVGLLCVLIAVTVVGNTLIIVAVITTRRLRTVTNCFVMSLAVADWLVGIFVMPPAVALQLMGSWELGWILCDIWISLDVLLCTASILSLCAISVDRYLAVTQPLNYSRRRRSKRLALFMILIVWMAALAITCPPILGWYESGRHEGKACRYNQNLGYVVFSAMGSFFLPLVVMVYVYARISCVVSQRHNQLTVHDCRQKKSKKLTGHEESDVDRGLSSEGDDNHHIGVARCTSLPRDVIHYNNHQLGARTIRSHYSPYCPSPCKELSSAPVNPFPPAASYYTRPRPESLPVDLHSTIESSSRVSSFRRESKTAQTLSIVVGGFVACWLPFFVIYLLTPFFKSGTMSPLLMSFLTWLGWINSAINPFIYAFYSPDFRIAFWRLTFRHCSGPRRPTDPAFALHRFGKSESKNTNDTTQQSSKTG